MRNTVVRMWSMASGALITGVALLSCAGGPRSDAAPTPQVGIHDRIAREIAQASPPTDTADPRARDAAGERLLALDALASASRDTILWGGFDPQKGYDPAAYRLTLFSTPVWIKLYLSTFMFPGTYEVRRHGRFDVLEMAAQFRAELDPGDYPYPFWHAPKKWLGYVNTESVAFVFENDTLVAAYRKAAAEPAITRSRHKWDGRWTWTDERGEAQPRVALFSYLFSPDNPHVAELEGSYRRLEERFRAHNCMACHAPDNAALSDPLVLLNYPNQALAGRHTIAGSIRGDKMPPRDPYGRHPAGITDKSAREELIQLAEEFERVADAALAFEARK